MEEMECMDDIAVNQLHGGDGDGADMISTFNGSLISVSIFPNNGSSTKDSRHLSPEDLLSRAIVCEGYDEYDELEDEVLGVILDAGKELFNQRASSRVDLLYRATRLRQSNEPLEKTRIDPLRYLDE